MLKSSLIKQATYALSEIQRQVDILGGLRVDDRFTIFTTDEILKNFDEEPDQEQVKKYNEYDYWLYDNASDQDYGAYTTTSLVQMVIESYEDLTP